MNFVCLYYYCRFLFYIKQLLYGIHCSYVNHQYESSKAFEFHQEGHTGPVTEGEANAPDFQAASHQPVRPETITGAFENTSSSEIESQASGKNAAPLRSC